MMTRAHRSASRRGDWTPAHLTRRDNTLIVGVACAQVLFRAFDYGIGNDRVPRTIEGRSAALSLIGSAWPLRFWAIMLAATVALLCLGAWCRKHVIVWLGHGLLAVEYLALFIGILIPVLQAPYLDGIRGASVLLLPLAIHTLFWLRTGPRPLPPLEATTVETVAGPS